VKPAVKPAVTPAVKRDQPRFQLGAFVLRKNAEMLREIALTRLGLPPDAVRISEGGGLFRVQVGPYADRDESRRMLQKIKSGLGIDAFAVR
jgi:cell division protein FtsN